MPSGEGDVQIKTVCVLKHHISLASQHLQKHSLAMCVCNFVLNSNSVCSRSLITFKSDICQDFSSPEPHLTKRAYSIAMIWRPSVVRSHSSTIFSKTARLIIAKFHVEPPWLGGGESLFAASGSHDQHGRSIYGKNPLKIYFSETSGPIARKLGI